MTTAESIDAVAEVAAITATLKERVDPAYEAGMRRTVPSQQPAHAVRVPEIRRVSIIWARDHKAAPYEDLLVVAETLWRTGWREERIVAMGILERSSAARARLPWAVIERWTSEIDNWEHVDNLASMLIAPMLRARPDLIRDVEAMSSSAHVWQRRAALVTLIYAARADAGWLPQLRAMTAALKGDRGPTMRKAVDWARRTADKVGPEA
ncbi:MAG TPA: DNA alkylation repair protein [Dehalococcoidia bacterium]